MDSDSISSFESVGSSGSSICPVCQGIGDLKNPRGVSVKLPDDHFSLKRYAYVYMHYPSLRALCNHADCCDMCQLLRDTLKLHIAKGFDKAATAESDDDASIATDLAELTTKENLLIVQDFKHFGSRRIALRHFSDEETGPRGSRNDFDIEVLALGHNLPTSIWGFKHSRGSMFHDGILILLGDAKCRIDPLDSGREYPPYRHLLSDPHVDLINRWRETCGKAHSSCKRTPHIQQLPARVLKMYPSNENISVQLIETDGKMKGTYACLSYCWGHQSKENQIGQTLRQNIEQYKQAIPVQELPSTIVDTIRLCCKLGIEFLWVDRLCIVQDKDPDTDRDDWKIEASKMCDYYSQSALTVSVPICSESSQSFLAERQKGFKEQSQFAIVEYLDEESKSKSSLWLTSYLNGNKGSWSLQNPWIDFAGKRDSEGNGWSGRGWTFQEWMLSPRVLHINGLTLWDCFDGYANELDHREMKEPTLKRSPEEFGKDISWGQIVEEYSNRQVTKKTDRLPALAGLAERYRGVTHWTYLAGIWKEEMPFSLLWQAEYHAFADRPELTNQTTPSWSWAHSNGHIYCLFNGGIFSAKASVVDFECEYDPPGSLSTVVKSWLDIDGPLSIVQGQRREEVKAGSEWWESAPDDGDGYSEDAIHQRAIKLLILAVSKGRFRGKDFYGALVLHECGRTPDGRSVFRRVGLTSLEWSEDMCVELTRPGEGHLWKRESIRII